MAPYFEFCAIHYLEQWFCTEQALYLSLRGRNSALKLDAIADSVQFFGVARNLPKKFDTEIGMSRYEPLLAVVNEFEAKEIDGKNVLAVVKDFRSTLSAKYGGRDVLSLSTKILWLLHRDPVIIYDSRVRSALNAPEGNYPAYVEHWLSMFDVHAASIQTVCAALPKFYRYIRCGSRISMDLARAACEEEWFMKRVLDIYLWHQAASVS